MPYISTEQVTKVRHALKKAFPLKDGWTLSVTKHHHSMLRVAVMTAPFKMTDDEKGHESVNYFYIKDHFKDKPEIRDVLQKVYDIMNEGNRTVSIDGDYGNIPVFYVSLSIGSWDKPFVIKSKK